MPEKDLNITVIICAHNPPADYLSQVLEALRLQTLSKECWELLLIDNASLDRLEGKWDLSWHPKARNLREDDLGLTPARLRGIRESRGELLIFVDDDNVLAADYLSQALRLCREWPMLGAFGGNVIGEFEVDPEPWMKPFLKYLALREFDKPFWSNNPDDRPSLPCGAGLCARAAVAREYATLVCDNPYYRALGRTGTNLSSCEDTALVLCSEGLALGFGNFPELQLKHLIPGKRLKEDYLIRLVQEMMTSSQLLRYLRSGAVSPKPNRWNTMARYLLILIRHGRREARIFKASQDAIRIGIEIVRGLQQRLSKNPATAEEWNLVREALPKCST